MDTTELAMLLADAADDITLPSFQSKSLRITTKQDGTVVTSADTATEAEIRRLLAEHAPTDGVVGEEHGVTGADFRRWFIDPIDGTSSFAAGNPEWATMVALEDFEQLEVAVISSPALGSRWYARRGEGAWALRLGPLGGETTRLTVSKVDSPGMARVSVWPPPARLRPQWLPVARAFGEMADLVAGSVRGKEIKPSRDTGFPNAGVLVAAGALDGFLLCGGGPWDVAPLALLVEEAGGTYSDLHGGRDFAGGVALFTNGRIHDTLLTWAADHH